MDQLLPYELELNQQLMDLPLPDVNRAWADMKRRLDEDDNKRVIPWWRGCVGWGLLGIVLFGSGWWILRPEKWFDSKQKTEQSIPVSEKTTTTKRDTTLKYTDTTTTSANKQEDSLIIMVPDINSKTITTHKLPAEKKPETILKISRTNIRSIAGTVSKKKAPGENIAKDTTPVKEETKKNKIPPVGEKETVLLISDTAISKTDPVKPDKDPVVITKPVVVPDSIIKTTTLDSIVKKQAEEPVTKENDPKKDSTKKNPMVYSAGIGLHQQLPVAGQKWSSYGSSGRKNSIADYVPSIYFKATKPGKWFFQSEFRYGAPQQTKEIVFRQTVVNDTPRYITTTTSVLKKTYYHQVPLSFNYYVIRNWSVGAGMQWNNFYRAIAEREIVRHDNFLQADSSSGKFIVPLKKDSASEFRRSYWQAIVQTQYHWKRFTFGARYNFGLQPYLNFTLPGQSPKEEKNNSLQLYLLFELWKSKKK